VEIALVHWESWWGEKKVSIDAQILQNGQDVSKHGPNFIKTGSILNHASEWLNTLELWFRIGSARRQSPNPSTQGVNHWMR